MQISNDPTRVTCNGQLNGGGFKRSNPLRNGSWKIDKDEMSLVIEIILAALVHDPHEIVLSSSRIQDDSIHLARNQRDFVIGVIHAEDE